MRSFRGMLASLVLALLAVTGVAGCGEGSGGGQEEEASTLTVLAASSLTDAFGELETTFEEQNQGVDISTSFASSSDLLAQIQQGAPTDVFASADEAKMETALEEGLVAEPNIFARNLPVVIVPANNLTGIQEFRDLGEGDARLVLAEDKVPIAEYAKEVLANANSEYGDGFDQSVLDKIASQEANVRASANRVALGEADATFVYASDVTEDISERVRVVEIPENLNVLATYPIAPIESSPNSELARAWVDFVLSDEGQAGEVQLPAGGLKLKQRGLGGGGGADRLASGFAVAALALLAGFISLPLLSLIIWTVSEGSWRAMASPVARDALLLSVRTTAITMTIVIVVVTPAAFVLARAEFPGKRLVNTLVDIPAVLPPSAAGIALLLAFGRMGLLGEHLLVFGIQLSFTTAAVVLAELFVATHFYVRQAAVSFAQIDRDVEEAAMVDGASRARVFAKITVPLTLPALVAGAVTAWARALGEFGGTIIFAGSFRGVTQTLPLAIYGTLESDFDAAVALSVLVLGFSFAVILAARFFTRKAEERAG